MTSASGCASVTAATSLLTLTASAGAGAGVMYTAVGVSPDMALSICEARSSKGREAGARRGAGAGAWTTPAPTGPDHAFVPKALQSIHRRRRKGYPDRLGGPRGAGGWGTVRPYLRGWPRRICGPRAFAHSFGKWASTMLLAQGCGACVLGKLARPRGAPRACGGRLQFAKWEDANERRAAPAVSPLGVQYPPCATSDV